MASIVPALYSATAAALSGGAGGAWGPAAPLSSPRQLMVRSSTMPSFCAGQGRALHKLCAWNCIPPSSSLVVAGT